MSKRSGPIDKRIGGVQPLQGKEHRNPGKVPLQRRQALTGVESRIGRLWLPGSRVEPRHSPGRNDIAASHGERVKTAGSGS